LQFCGLEALLLKGFFAINLPMPFVADPVTIPRPVIQKKPEADDALAPTFYVICWNDPVNYMQYVV